jgi:hypothetical protein
MARAAGDGPQAAFMTEAQWTGSPHPQCLLLGAGQYGDDRVPGHRLYGRLITVRREEYRA